MLFELKGSYCGFPGGRAGTQSEILSEMRLVVTSVRKLLSNTKIIHFFLCHGDGGDSGTPGAACYRATQRVTSSRGTERRCDQSKYGFLMFREAPIMQTYAPTSAELFSSGTSSRWCFLLRMSTQRFDGTSSAFVRWPCKRNMPIESTSTTAARTGLLRDPCRRDVFPLETSTAC